MNEIFLKSQLTTDNFLYLFVLVTASRISSQNILLFELFDFIDSNVNVVRIGAGKFYYPSLFLNSTRCLFEECYDSKVAHPFKPA